MPTFRVSLRKKGSQPGIAWQYAETVSGGQLTPDQAAQIAYDKWRAEPGSLAPASLGDCDRQVTPVG